MTHVAYRFSGAAILIPEPMVLTEGPVAHEFPAVSGLNGKWYLTGEGYFTETEDSSIPHTFYLHHDGYWRREAGPNAAHDSKKAAEEALAKAKSLEQC
jgi:hypothetical protein